MKIYNKAILPLIFLVLLIESAFPISVGVHSSQDYYYTMNVLRQIKPMIENFKNDELYNSYKEMQLKFEKATLYYYSNKFDDSYVEFYDLKLSMMKFLEKLADVYIKRTDALLTASIKDNNAITIFLEYNKQSGYAGYFKKPYDPLNDIKPYNTDFTAKDYHFFYDSPKIEDWLHSGYYYYSKATSIYNDKEIEFIKTRKKIKTDNINFVIEKYLDVIKMCRTAKQCALEIYKCKNEQDIGTILNRYKIRKDQITPIFDDRIPEDYKVDAVDNFKQLYSVELERRKKALGQ